MHRIDHATKDVDLFGSGKHGFTEGAPGTEAATVVTDDWLNGVQEEIANTIEGAGITLVKGTRDQLFDAICAVVGHRGVHLSEGQPNQSDWEFRTIDGEWRSLVNSGSLIIPLHVRPWAGTIYVDIYCKPGAARTSTNKVGFGIFSKPYGDDTDNTEASLVYDDGTTNFQTITNSFTATVDEETIYFIKLYAGNTGAASTDYVCNGRIRYA